MLPLSIILKCPKQSGSRVRHASPGRRSYSLLVITVSEIVEDTEMIPTAKLGELVKLAELCVDVLQENNDFYQEVRCLNHVS
jgi:uncharacterized protein (DUF927 family)